MILNIIVILISITLIVAILLQSQGSGLSSAFGGGGGSGSYRSKRSVEKLLYWLTIVVAIIFALISIILLIPHK